MKIIKIKKFAIYVTKNLVLIMKTKVITKLKIIVNLLVSTRVLAIRSQLYFIMVPHMTTILLSMSLQIILKNMIILSVWVKTVKNISQLVFLSKKS